MNAFYLSIYLSEYSMAVSIYLSIRIIYYWKYENEVALKYNIAQKLLDWSNVYFNTNHWFGYFNTYTISHPLVNSNYSA